MTIKFKILCVGILLSVMNPLFLSADTNERKLWIDHLSQISYPILRYTAVDSLKIMMPVYTEATRKFQYLEALGRTICGIAPWIELPDGNDEEGLLRRKFRAYAIKAISNAVNPSCKDYMNFKEGNLPLVDAAYLAQGLLRAPTMLWNKLDKETQHRVLKELKETRRIIPGNSNWLLFASMVEACLLEYEGECDDERLINGVERFIFSYYHGDGMYGDGANFAMDYYNSFVIHPMLTDVIRIGCKHKLDKFDFYRKIQWPRLQRYSVIQERMISPEGTYPVWGRTLICKNGTFHALAETAFLKLLPEILSPNQVRSAMTAVLKRQFPDSVSSFDNKGFLLIGFVGEQKNIAENYVSSGSPYHCMTFFLPLGLSGADPFWSLPCQEWTSVKAFGGEDILADHGYEDNKDQQLMVEYQWVQLSKRKKQILIFTGICVLILNVLGVMKIYQFLKYKK